SARIAVTVRTVRVCGGPERARLHVLAREVSLPLERAEVIVHSVRRANAHACADLAQRRRVTAVGDRLADEVEHHLLALSQTLHGVQSTERTYPSQANGLHRRFSRVHSCSSVPPVVEELPLDGVAVTRLARVRLSV